MTFEPEGAEKPLAGNCHHRWRKQKSAFLISEVCDFCKLLRYKAAATSDWEYRAPIRFQSAPNH